MLGKQWHRYTLGLLPIAVFTWFMGLATFLHWDRFNHSHISFYTWLALYIITPFLVPFLWLRNRASDPGTPEPDDVIVPSAVRWAAGAVGGGLLAIAGFMFLFPEAAVAVWPWRLTPLTSRVVGGWFGLLGTAGVCFARDARWSAWRILLHSQIISVLIILLGVPRAWGDFDPNNPLTWLFIIGGMGVLLVAVSVLYFTMESRRHKGRAYQEVAAKAAE